MLYLQLNLLLLVNFEFDYHYLKIPEFQFESHATNLARCQRYFYKTFDQGTTPAQNVSDGNYLLAVGTDTGSRSHGSIEFPVAMRADPTITTFNPFAANASGRQPNSSTDVAFKEVNAKLQKLKLDKFIDIEIDNRSIKYAINEESLKEESKLDGCYCLVTNLDQADADKATIYMLGTRIYQWSSILLEL